mgnify:CR=1 FL=1
MGIVLLLLISLNHKLLKNNFIYLVYGKYNLKLSKITKINFVFQYTF